MAHNTEDYNAGRDVAANFGLAAIASGVRAYVGVLALLTVANVYDPANAVHCAGMVDDPESSMDYNNVAAASLDPRVRILKRGVVGYELDSGAPPLTSTPAGTPLFAVDNVTLSLQPFAADGAARPYVGTLERVDGGRAFVELDPAHAPAKLGAKAVAPTQTLAADGDLVFNRYQTTYPVAGDGGAVELTEDFPDGDFDGQAIALRGTHDTNKVTVSTGVNTKLAGGVDAVLGGGDVLCLQWYAGGSAWIETSRAMNA